MTVGMVCLASMTACASRSARRCVGACQRLSGTTHSGMSQDIGNTRTLKVRVLSLVGLVRAAGVEGEFSPYEGTAARYCGWNLSARLHSVVVGRVGLADEAAADAWHGDLADPPHQATSSGGAGLRRRASWRSLTIRRGSTAET